jgi:hypothetical protein
MKTSILIAMFVVLLLPDRSYAMDYFSCQTNLQGSDGRTFSTRFFLAIEIGTSTTVTLGPLGSSMVSILVAPVWSDPKGSFLVNFMATNEHGRQRILEPNRDGLNFPIQAGTSFDFSYLWAQEGTIGLRCEVRSR